MFELLGDRLDGVFRGLKSRGVLTAPMLREALREVRRALLEADVNFQVAKGFLGRVEKRALGESVLKSIRPGDQVVKIVHDELVAVLGGEGAAKLAESAVPPTVIMLVGLQGSGKTTTAAKLARRLAGEGRRPVLVGCDPYRPAAGDQLASLAESIGVPVLHDPDEQDVVRFANGAIDRARRTGMTHVLLDTAGRLQADEPLIRELADLREAAKPDEILFVADGMTGQEAVRIARGFDDAIGITGVVLTKMDGDTRGGAALS
ncbi:MAG: signal recognition particle receptor subunit alpha, partial [Gemmatimonadota bacterium]|nr:signal recognition particle receptor subunit alpha [Gemmatimonadota bacterium]